MGRPLLREPPVLTGSAMGSAPSKSPESTKRALPIYKDFAKTVLKNQEAHELIFSVVGYIGSGAGTVAAELKARLVDKGFDVSLLKASAAIRAWATETGKSLPPERPLKSDGSGKREKYLDDVSTMQDLGDGMRATDHAAVAVGLVRMIREDRAQKTSKSAIDGEPVFPDGRRRAYVLDGLRHDAEVHLLRRLYGNSFVLVGVVCDPKKREARLKDKYEDGGSGKARKAMQRDEDDRAKDNGQKVRKAFWLSDCFVDNSTDHSSPRGTVVRPHPKVTDQLDRLIRIVSYSAVERPTLAETAMYVAYGAARRSACLSRSVGAALVDQKGNIVASGVNDVPKAGGGLYGAELGLGSADHKSDHRCAYYGDDQALDESSDAHCRNTREQKRIVDGMITVLADLSSNDKVQQFYNGAMTDGRLSALQAAVKALSQSEKELLADILKKEGKIGELTEYSRAVHAEMETLLSAARSGISPVGSRLFVTTFPCHYCARHIVSAGVDEVQYIEPYPKSHALDLHRDSITQDEVSWTMPSKAGGASGTKVLFRPFVGVSPSLYERVFTRDREWKDQKTGVLRIQQESEWGSSLYLGKLSCFELEAKLTSTTATDTPPGGKEAS